MGGVAIISQKNYFEGVFKITGPTLNLVKKVASYIGKKSSGGKLILLGEDEIILEKYIGKYVFETNFRLLNSCKINTIWLVGSKKSGPKDFLTSGNLLGEYFKFPDNFHQPTVTFDKISISQWNGRLVQILP